MNLALDFGACSGAKTYDLDDASSTTGPPWNDGISQYGRLNSSTKLVTIGIGGNNLDFSGILQYCIKSGLMGLFSTEDTCQNQFDQRLEDNWNTLVDGNVLENVYREIRSRAPYSRIARAGLPALLRGRRTRATATPGTSAGGCASPTRSGSTAGSSGSTTTSGTPPARWACSTSTPTTPPTATSSAAPATSTS